jgi:hypothetical protein
MIIITFKGGHGDGERIEIDGDEAPATIDARCPDCGQLSSYELIAMKRTRHGIRARYRAIKEAETT